MKTYRYRLSIQSAFGSPLLGDTLFGQICWGIVLRNGEDKLKQLLKGYNENKPFIVVSDAFPTGYFPLPVLPSYYWNSTPDADRKALKKKKWIKTEMLSTLPLADWQQNALADSEVVCKVETLQFHNTLNRETHTTGVNEFAPYTMNQIWYAPETKLDIYIVIDETQLSLETLNEVLNDIGISGFGRDASIGLGKFTVDEFVEFNPYKESNYNAYLTLANCAPSGLNLDKEKSYYQVTTRFGRHGNMIGLTQNPFKKPIILAKSSAVFTPNVWKACAFLGNGLCNISFAQSEAVHQGYAPIIPIMIEHK